MNENKEGSGETLPAVYETGTGKPNRETEAALLGHRLALAYQERTAEYIRYSKMRPEEAHIRARRPSLPYTADELRTLAPDKVTWGILEEIGYDEPQKCWEKWDEILTYAEQQLHSGILGASAASDASPLQRAEYMAIRDELGMDWEPRNGIERILIDQMTQAHVQFLLCQQRMTSWLAFEDWIERRNPDPLLPRVTVAQAIEQAGVMAERFHRIFLRSLRALQSMRRAPIVVQNAEQVNIADKQVNIGKQAADQ